MSFSQLGLASQIQDDERKKQAQKTLELTLICKAYARTLEFLREHQEDVRKVRTDLSSDSCRIDFCEPNFLPEFYSLDCLSSAGTGKTEYCRNGRDFRETAHDVETKILLIFHNFFSFHPVKEDDLFFRVRLFDLCCLDF